MVGESVLEVGRSIELAYLFSIGRKNQLNFIIMTMMRTKFQTKKRTQKRFVVGLVDTNRQSIIKGKKTIT